MITQTLEHRKIRTKTAIRSTPSHDVPPIAPGTEVIREIECDGEPPIEALRNSGMC